MSEKLKNNNYQYFKFSRKTSNRSFPRDVKPSIYWRANTHIFFSLSSDKGIEDNKKIAHCTMN